MSKTEFAAGGQRAALRGLAEASGHDLEYVVRLANRGELGRLFAGGKRFRIDSRPETADALTTARAAQLRLLAKRHGPTS